MDRLQHIIIGGSPRSGSTALARLLGTHKDFMVTNEFGIYNGWNDPNKWKGFERAKDFDSFKANEEIFDSKDFDLYDFRQVVIDNRMSGKQVFSLLYENISAKYYGDKCPMSYLEKMQEHLMAFTNPKDVIKRFKKHKVFV